MNATTKTALMIAFAIVVALLLLFGGALMTGTTFSGGMMGGDWINGNGWMGGNRGGISWMWVPVLLMLGLGIVLIWAIFGEKK